MLKHFMPALAVLMGTLCSTSLVAQTLPKEVSTVFAQARVPAQSIGVMVKDMQGKTILSVNASQAFAPASTMKLMTTSAALDLLGPSFTWRTGAYIDGKLDEGDLDGNLYFQGSGDPQLVMEKLWLFLKEIRDKGIKTIDGNVVLDTHLFAADESRFVSFDDDPQNPYNAFPEAFLVNYKSFAVHLMPKPDEHKVSAVVEPHIKAKIIAPQLGQGECGDWKKQLQLSFSGSSMQINGSYPASCGEQVWYVYPDTLPSLTYFSWIFKEMWAELGGKFNGEVVAGPLSDAARSFAEWQSPSLTQIIYDMNKYSNNVMARQILLTMAANVSSVPARVEDGQAVIQQWLDKARIPSAGMVVDNGSGLSRDARLTPQTLSSVLVAMYQSPYMPEFMSSLPIIGVDGTMKKRLTQSPVKGWGHIKTGYLSDARAVAGYVHAKSGKYYAVVGFVNGDKAGAAKDGLDSLLEWVYRQ